MDSFKTRETRARREAERQGMKLTYFKRRGGYRLEPLPTREARESFDRSLQLRRLEFLDDVEEALGMNEPKEPVDPLDAILAIDADMMESLKELLD